MKSICFLILATVAFGTACAGPKSRSESTPSNQAAPEQKPALLEEQPGEVSLKSDRSDLDAARKDIPEEIKKQNDEIATVMSFIVRDSEEEPNRLRDRFSAALRKKREAVDKKVHRAREDFTKRERNERETFLRKSKDERDKYLAGGKRTPDDRKRFFGDQEDRRKSFFADQTEKRKDFEMHIQEERKAVEDFAREKQSAFNEEWRAYQTRYSERKKQNELKKRMEQKSRELERNGKPVSPVTPPSEAAIDGQVPTYPGSVAPTPSAPPKDPLAEFDQIPPGPAVQLAPGKKGP